MRFSQFLEAFENPSKFLLDPKNNNKTLRDLEDELSQDGGEVLGVGRYSSVYDHPKWPYVLKVFPADEHYVRFARFAYRNPHPAFPKIFGPPQLVVPNYLRYKNATKVYMVRIEKLKPIMNRELLDGIFKYRESIKTCLSIMKSMQSGYIPDENEKHHWYNEHNLNFIKKYPQVIKYFDGLEIIERSDLKGALDHYQENNTMQRDNGELVIIDPLWEGSNPYANYAAYIARETDSFPDDEPSPPDVVGGKYPQRIKKKKPKLYRPDRLGDEPPF